MCSEKPPFSTDSREEEETAERVLIRYNYLSPPLLLRAADDRAEHANSSSSAMSAGNLQKRRQGRGQSG